MLVYRVVKHDPPTLQDFLSNAAVGKLPPPGLRMPEQWDGVSVVTSENEARWRAVRYSLGDYIATLDILEDGPIRYRQTSRDHMTLWAEPGEMLARVVGTSPLADDKIGNSGLDTPMWGNLAGWRMRTANLLVLWLRG